MNPEKFAHQFTRIVDELSDCTDMEKNGFFHEYKDSDPIPSSKALEEIMELCRAIFFPGYYGKSSINHATLKYNIGVNVERLYTLLSQQVVAGLCFGRVNAEGDSVYATYLKAEEICCQIVNKLPEMRATLETDVIAAYNYGQGLISYITPTGLILASLAMVDVPFSRWLKFINPLLGATIVLNALLLIAQALIG